ncbi:MAG: hypothetical protein U0169_06830 [Polyangiaceae bacterium]
MEENLKRRVVGALALTLLGGCASSVEAPPGAVDDTVSESSDALRTAKLLCSSRADAPIYFGDESQILLTADIDGDRGLKKVSLTMKADDKLGVRNEDIVAQASYRPRNPLYANHQKYNAADAWCGYGIVAPKGLATKRGSFPVYLQQACEGGFIATATLNCKVQAATPTPGGPTSGAAIVLTYAGARKADVISGRYFKPSDFTGNDVVVADEGNSVDIATILPESDTSAPDTLCYRGPAADAKKILERMLLNTDGNGDHFLDEGYTLTVSRSTSIVEVRFSVTGEGGSEDKSLSVPPCR